MPVIHIQDLKKSYAANQILKGINLDIEEGEFYALMGSNGSGKSTLAAILSSVIRFDSGIVEIYGKRPEQVKRWISYIPQDNFSIPQLTGRENLRYFTGLAGYQGNKAQRLVEEMLDKVGLSAEANKRVSHYSGGMRKRLELATALLPDVRILILDEPTAGLDPGSRRGFLNLVRELKNQSTTIFLITHINTDAGMADRVGLIDQGKIVVENTPAALRTTSGDEDRSSFYKFAKQIIQEAN